MCSIHLLIGAAACEEVEEVLNEIYCPSTVFWPVVCRQPEEEWYALLFG